MTQGICSARKLGSLVLSTISNTDCRQVNVLKMLGCFSDSPARHMEISAFSRIGLNLFVKPFWKKIRILCQTSCSCLSSILTVEGANAFLFVDVIE